jgi:hypothetical protein
MNKKQIQLSEKQAQLINRAAQQRLALRRDIEPWRAPLALTDRSITALRYVRRHPQWVVGTVILLTIARPARALKWLERGLILWKMTRSMGTSSQRGYQNNADS